MYYYYIIINGVVLDFGKVKNVNKNPVAERCNQELEVELLKMDPSGSIVTPLALSTATDTLNSRIRHHGLSAKEVVFGCPSPPLMHGNRHSRNQMTCDEPLHTSPMVQDRPERLTICDHIYRSVPSTIRDS